MLDHRSLPMPDHAGGPPVGRPRRPGRVVLVAALALVVVAACAPRVPVPANDPSPPDQVWWTVVQGSSSTTLSGPSAQHQIHRGQQITVWFQARDSQGLRSISLGSTTSFTCSDGDIGQVVGPGLIVPDRTDFTPDAQGTVPTEGLKTTTVGPGPGCPAGLTFDGATTSLYGSASNWGNGSANATLTVKILP